MVAPVSKGEEYQTPARARRISAAVSKRLYTLKEAAEYLGRSEWSMRSLIWAGSIPVVKTDRGRKIFVDIEDLDDFISQNKSIYR